MMTNCQMMMIKEAPKEHSENKLAKNIEIKDKNHSNFDSDDE